MFKYAYDALESTWISSQGKYMNQVPEMLEEALGVKYALLCNNGTSAMHLVARTLKYKYPDIKGILVPNNVYVAAWNAFLFDKEFTLYPIDADVYTWNVDISKLQANADKAYAILWVHNLGNTIDAPQMRRYFPEHVFVEDACEAFGGTYLNRALHAGTASFCSGLSFFANKNITCGEGGAFLTNSLEAYKYARLLWGQGQSATKFIHDDLGYNYRMTNVQAAILRGQLEYAVEIMEMKTEVFNRYFEAFTKEPTLRVQQTIDGGTHSLWMYGVRIPGNPGYDRAKEFFDRHHIETRPMFYPITRHKHLSHIECETDVAELLAQECIVIPSYPELAMEKEIQDYIIKKVIEYSREGWR